MCKKICAFLLSVAASTGLSEGQFGQEVMPNDWLRSTIFYANQICSISDEFIESIFEVSEDNSDAVSAQNVLQRICKDGIYIYPHFHGSLNEVVIKNIELAVSQISYHHFTIGVAVKYLRQSLATAPNKFYSEDLRKDLVNFTDAYSAFSKRFKVSNREVVKEWHNNLNFIYRHKIYGARTREDFNPFRGPATLEARGHHRHLVR